MLPLNCYDLDCVLGCFFSIRLGYTSHAYNPEFGCLVYIIMLRGHRAPSLCQPKQQLQQQQQHTRTHTHTHTHAHSHKILQHSPATGSDVDLGRHSTICFSTLCFFIVTMYYVLFIVTIYYVLFISTVY